MKKSNNKDHGLYRRKTLLGGVCWLALVALWLWGLTADTVMHAELRQASESYPFILGFLLISVLAMMFLLPGLMITITAGYLFGLLKGLVYVVVASTVGATLAFILGRRIFKEPLLKYLDGHHPLLFNLNNGLKHKGGLIVFLTRLIPMFPFKLSNYYFGAANYRLPGFVLGTALGIIPMTTFNVTLGVAIARLDNAPPIEVATTQPWWLIISGGISLACLIALISRQAWNSLNDIKNQNHSPQNPEEHKHA